MTVRWGLLSTARINQPTIAAARESERASIDAVASRDGARAAEYARANGIARAHGSYDALLADPEIDAVYVSLPNSLHTEWSIRALEAGKHVLCEKPFSATAADVSAAFDAAEANGRLLMEAFMYRHHPQTTELVRLLQAGAIGTPRLVRALFAFNAVRIFGGDANIRFDNDLGGGALLDVGAYCVSSIRLVGGEPSRVHGAAVAGPGGVDVAFAGTLEFESGLLGQFTCSFDVDGRSELEILGTDGRLVLRQPWRIVEPGIELWRGGTMEAVPCAAADPYALQLENFSAAIAGDDAPLLGRDDAIGQARVLEALAAAAAAGEPVLLT